MEQRGLDPGCGVGTSPPSLVQRQPRNLGVLGLPFYWASLKAQLVKNLSAMQETRVRSLGQEDPLKEEMATDSSILTWRIQWTEEPGGPQSTGSQKKQT